MVRGSYLWSWNWRKLMSWQLMNYFLN